MAQMPEISSRFIGNHPLYRRWARFHSTAMKGVCVLFTVLILAVLALVTGYLLVLGFKHLSLDFFTQVPVSNTQNPDFPGGMKHALVGTGILVGLASAVGVPLGILTGVYLSEYSANSWLAKPVRFIADVLNGVPSIVVGILGYELVVVPLGVYGYAGAFALAFIMVPIVARTTEEMLLLVPQSYREASVALGATKAATILRVVLPSASGSIVTGVMLAVARIAGETAPLLFTILGTRLLVTDPAEVFPALSLQIYRYSQSHLTEQQQLAWAGMLVLIALIFLVNLAVRITVYRTQTKKFANN